MVVGVLPEPAAGLLEIAGEHKDQGSRGMETGNAAGAVERVADVVEPEDFAIGGIQEGHVEARKSQGVPAASLE